MLAKPNICPLIMKRWVEMGTSMYLQELKGTQSRAFIEYLHLRMDHRPVPPKTVTSASAVASISRQAIASSNTVNDSGPLYPDLSDILRQNGKGNSPSQLQHVPGAFEPSVKPKPPSKSAVAGEGSSIRDSHQSQEPTPPLSNVDLQYPRSDNLSTTPEIAPARMPVFPTGNHQNNLRARTDTLVLNDSPTSANNDQATISKLRRRRLFGNAEEDFFESIPSTPRKSRTVRVPREPPQLIEGPFGSLLTDGRPLVRLGWKETVHERVNSDKSDEDGSNEGEGDKSNEPEWPPRRSSQKLNVATSKVESKNNKPAGILPSTKAPSTTALSTSGTPRHTHIESANGGQPGSVSTRQGTLATSSRVNHDPLHLPTRPQHTGESSLLPMQPTKTVQKLFDGLSRRITAALPNVQVADSNTGALQVSFTGQAIGSSAGELSSNVTRHLSPDSPGGLDGDYTFPWRPESGSDPFLVSAAPRGKHNSLGKEKVDVLFTDRDRRKTFGGFDPSPNVPDIDLSVVMKRPYHRLIRPNRQSLPAPGPSATTQAAASFRRVSAPVRNPSILNSSSSSASVMSTADQNMALRLGTDLIFRRMAENHGFHEDTVRRIYAEVGGFERADAVLNDMREAAEAAGRKSIILDPVDVPAHTSPLRRDSDRPSGLQFTPAPITSDDRSDYSPPEASRAGQYARLVRQGRRQEALKREARAVSLGGHSDFLRKIRMSEGVSFRATSTRSSQSPLALMKDARATAAEVAPPPPPESHWGEKEDHLLQSADETVLRELESRMGKVALRRRIQDSLHTLVRNYT